MPVEHTAQILNDMLEVYSFLVPVEHTAQILNDIPEVYSFLMPVEHTALLLLLQEVMPLHMTFISTYGTMIFNCLKIVCL